MLLLAGVVEFAGIRWLGRNTKESYVSDFNPAGDQFIVWESDTRTGRRGTALVLDANDGGVLCDLSSFTWRQDSLRWSRDGDYLVGVVENRREMHPMPKQSVVVVAVTEPPRIVKQWDVPRLVNIHEVMFDGQGRVVQVQQQMSESWSTSWQDMTSRPRLDIVVDQSISLGSIEFGKEESPIVLPTRGDNPINILFRPSQRHGADIVFSGGTKMTTCEVDPQTAKITRQVRVQHHPFDRNRHLDIDVRRGFIYRYGSDGKTSVFRDSDPQTAILEIDSLPPQPSPRNIVSVSGHRFVGQELIEEGSR
jgi:hypothetical protein